MAIFQTAIGGPLALAGKNTENPGHGVPMTLHESTWSRGDVCQFLNPALASIDGVDTGKVDTAGGTLDNAGLIDDATDGFCAVANSPTPVPTGQEGKAVVDGTCFVSVWFADVGGNSNAINEGDTIYLVQGEKYVTVDAALAGETVGRKCGVVLETLALGARTAGAASLVRCFFTGLPPHCR